MRALNKPTKFADIKYPRNSPRISRKRNWMDRSEWRKDPMEVGKGSEELIDRQLENARNVGSLELQNYQDLPDLANRAGRIGLRKL